MGITGFFRRNLEASIWGLGWETERHGSSRSPGRPRGRPPVSHPAVVFAAVLNLGPWSWQGCSGDPRNMVEVMVPFFWDDVIDNGCFHLMFSFSACVFLFSWSLQLKACKEPRLPNNHVVGFKVILGPEERLGVTVTSLQGGCKPLRDSDA